MTAEKNAGPRLVSNDPTDIFNDIEALRKQARPPISKHELLTVITVGRPSPDGYFRVHPDPEMTLPAMLFRLKDDKDGTVYFVPGEMQTHPMLIRRLREVLFVVTYTWPQRQIGLWPVPLGTEGPGVPWWESARAACEIAKTKWTQMSLGEGCYRVSVAEGDLPEPEWPKRSLKELLKAGLRDKIIADEDHPVMRRLRGLA